jgi:hypothetical protein
VLQRACACGQHDQGGECAQCRRKRETTLQRAARGPAPTLAPPIVHDVIGMPGQPLDQATRARMEPRFGRDFSAVRVHTDAPAARSARAVSALAYTVGPHIAFDSGRYAPGSSAGQQLLAHELAHVSQQGGAIPAGAGPIAVDARHSPLEHEADAAATLVTSQRPARVTSAGSGLLSRQIGAGLEQPATRRERRPGAPLSYREATELMACIRIMGNDNQAYCRQEVLGERPPPPSHVQIAGITTPQPFGTQRRRDGSTNYDVGGVNVTFQPDAQSQDQKLANGAETSISIKFGAINWSSRDGAAVSSFTGPGAARATIRTTYGPGATAAGSSGYGRGTTQPDKRAGKTSLGFHEGQHGLDFVEFLAAHPFPQFGGAIGMPIQDFKDAITAYHAAIQQYDADIKDFSVQQTDCVGTTIDQFNIQKGIVSHICRQRP